MPGERSECELPKSIRNECDFLFNCLGKVLIYVTFSFIRLDRIVISLGAMRIPGITLGFLTFLIIFSQASLIHKIPFYHIFLPILVLLSWVSIRSIQDRLSGTTSPTQTLRPSQNSPWVSDKLGLPIFGPSQLGLPN